MLKRPESIRANTQHIEDLAVFGGSRCATELLEYLNEIGVALPSSEHPEWCYPTLDAMLSLFPANSEVELARRLSIRDPIYRYHLDLALCSTLHAIGVSQRWHRFEQVVFETLQPMAPRILQLTRFVAKRFGVPARELNSDHWTQVGDDAYRELRRTFQAWDRELWGECRGASDLFPLLLDLYVPLCEASIFFRPSKDEQGFLDELIGAATVGEGLHLSTSQVPLAISLASRGLPLEIEEFGGATFTSLVSSLAIPSEGIVDSDSISVVKGIPKIATCSRLCLNHDLNPIESVRPDQLILLQQRIAIVSIPLSAGTWTEQVSSSAQVPWAGIPAKSDLDTVGNWVSSSVASDAALRQLAVHPLYGFLLQVLLIEALDRELGNENLVFALQPNQKLNDASAWAAIKVLFRDPKVERSSSLIQLGSLDANLTQVSKQIGISRLVTPYVVPDAGAWSTAFSLMNSAGLIDGTADGWILTINPLVFDRLHRGTLMKDVIRGGRQFRDHVSEIFSTLAAESLTRTEAPVV